MTLEEEEFWCAQADREAPAEVKAAAEQEVLDRMPHEWVVA
jgi:hypothetical protein